jgi:hypothetical protein
MKEPKILETSKSASAQCKTCIPLQLRETWHVTADPRGQRRSTVRAVREGRQWPWEVAVVVNRRLGGAMSSGGDLGVASLRRRWARGGAATSRCRARGNIELRAGWRPWGSEHEAGRWSHNIELRAERRPRGSELEAALSSEGRGKLVNSLGWRIEATPEAALGGTGRMRIWGWDRCWDVRVRMQRPSTAPSHFRFRSRVQLALIYFLP